MLLQYEYARDKFESPTERIKKKFNDKIVGNIDAEYLDAGRTKAFGICGLPIYMPVAILLLESSSVCSFLEKTTGDSFFKLDSKIIYITDEGEHNVPDDIAFTIIQSIDRAARGIGEFGNEGEVKFDLKGLFVGSHYTINLLLGNRIGYDNVLLSTPKSSVDEFGRGAFREGASGQVLASRYVLNMDEAGEPSNRQFYLVENGKQIFYSADIKRNVKKAFCTQLPNRTVIEYETECGLKIKRTIFILPQYEGMPQATEVQSVSIENNSGRKRTIKIVMTGMFGVSDPDGLINDIVYVNIIHESGTVSKNGKVFALSPHHKPPYSIYSKRFAALFSDGDPLDEYSTSLRDFIGNGNIEHPDGVLKLNSREMRKEAPFFALAKELCIDDGEKKHVDEFVGIVHENENVIKSFDEKLSNLRDRFSDHAEVENALADVVKFQNEYSSYLNVKTGDSMMDAYVNNDLPFQVLYQSFISRSFAWTQKAFREIGFREIQDMYPSVYYFAAMGQSELAKQMLANWITNVYEFGYANHNFFYTGHGQGGCSDDQLWLIQAIYRYVSLTGDKEILNEKYLMAGSDKERTLFDTLCAIVTYSAKISVGKHGLPLLDGADWNDCLRLDNDSLSGPEKERLYYKQLSDKGQNFGVQFESDLSESVMNAFLLKIAEDELAEMSGWIGNSIKMNELIELSKILNDRIIRHAWKGDFFARCLINKPDSKYKYVGAMGDDLGVHPNKDSYFLNSFSWSILSGVASSKQITIMLERINEFIKVDAGLMLCSPCDLSRISSAGAVDHYFHGDRENGAVFKHATMMATAAMLKASKKVEDEDLAKNLSDLSFWMMDRVLPYKCLDNPYVFKGNPRFCTQYVNSETMESVGPMLSGTASWLALTVFSMLGIDYCGESIELKPILPSYMKNVSYVLRRGKTVYNISIEKGEGYKRVNSDSVYTIDGKYFEGKIPNLNDGKEHFVRLVL